MSASMLILDPTAPDRPDERVAQKSVERLDGKVIGFIDNSKPNFNYLVEDLSELLVKDHGVARVITRRKRGSGMPAPEAMLSELAAECDALITGSGD